MVFAKARIKVKRTVRIENRLKPTQKFAWIISVAVGAAIWALSPVLTGHVEPWDGNFEVFAMSLVIVSLSLGIKFPNQVFVSSSGVFLGQLGYMVFVLQTGPLIIVGVAFLLGYTMVFCLPFAFLGTFVRTKWYSSK